MQRWIQTRRALCSAPALPYLRCRGEQKGGSEKPILRQRRHQRPAQEQEGQAARSGCALTTLSPECCQGGFGTYRTTPAGLGVDQGRVPSARPVAQQRLQDCTGPHRVHREVLNPIAGRFWNRLACAVASRANSGHRCEFLRARAAGRNGRDGAFRGGLDAALPAGRRRAVGGIAAFHHRLSARRRRGVGLPATLFRPRADQTARGHRMAEIDDHGA